METTVVDESKLPPLLRWKQRRGYYRKWGHYGRAVDQCQRSIWEEYRFIIKDSWLRILGQFIVWRCRTWCGKRPSPIYPKAIPSAT